jgi:sialic acid synthase SpsE
MAKTALDALNEQDIKVRDWLQAKVDSNEFCEFWTRERVQESIDSYQFNIDYYNQWKEKQRKAQMYG